MGCKIRQRFSMSIPKWHAKRLLSKTCVGITLLNIGLFIIKEAY